jgi:hypothetical protein
VHDDTLTSPFKMYRCSAREEKRTMTQFGIERARRKGEVVRESGELGMKESSRRRCVPRPTKAKQYLVWGGCPRMMNESNE